MGWIAILFSFTATYCVAIYLIWDTQIRNIERKEEEEERKKFRKENTRE